MSDSEICGTIYKEKIMRFSNIVYCSIVLETAVKQVIHMSDRKKAPLYKSFSYAFEGIFTCIRKERNIKIHCVFMFLVIIAGLLLHLSMTEWCICLILFGLILSLELVNTAVESVVDLVTEERKPLAKVAKDTAAGAVLISAIMAAIIGCIIFVPKIAVFLGFF